MDLREILNQIKGAYDGDGVRIISSELGERSSEGRKIETLHLIYEFNGYKNEKLFAIWNSSRSDRLFLASLSACKNTDNAKGKSDNNRDKNNNNNINVLLIVREAVAYRRGSKKRQVVSQVQPMHQKM